MSTARTGSSGHARPRDEATEHIECYILEKKLPPHAKLPSERDMCSMWNFNRTTLRSAIKRLIVEGVETAQQAEYLRACGADMIQGFYYARPMPSEQLVTFLQEHAAPQTPSA